MLPSGRSTDKSRDRDQSVYGGHYSCQTHSECLGRAHRLEGREESSARPGIIPQARIVLLFNTSVHKNWLKQNKRGREWYAHMFVLELRLNLAKHGGANDKSGIDRSGFLRQSRGDNNITSSNC